MKRFRIKSSFLVVLALASLFALIGFVEKKQTDKLVKNVVVNINTEYDNYFIDENDVMRLLTNNNEDFLINKKYEDISLKELEERIKSHKFVENAQVFKDHKGNVLVEIDQSRPIARLIEQDGPHFYISSRGKVLSTSEKFTSRVVLIDGAFIDRLRGVDFLQTDEGKPYFELLKLIDEDSFWKAQIAQLTINKIGEIEIQPQVGKELIKFGLPEDIESKFKRLKVFYKKILPVKGWNKYTSVNIKYKDQIICE